MIPRLLTGSRYLIVIAALCMLVAALALTIYGGILTFQIITDTIATAAVSAKGAKKLIIHFIELADLFLISTVLYVIAVGLYELFIRELNLPNWLVITNLDMLKDKLIGVIVVVLSVFFLGQVVSWDGQRDLLGYGGAIALIIATLTYFLSQKSSKKASSEAKAGAKASKPDTTPIGEGERDHRETAVKQKGTSR
ncbi:MAG: YqhA family protein [Chloroflexaceae bacterium]|nr:YqhA family protein [Chloroflexaceae bacterium]